MNNCYKYEKSVLERIRARQGVEGFNNGGGVVPSIDNYICGEARGMSPQATFTRTKK